MITPVEKYGRVRLSTGFRGKETWRTSVSGMRLYRFVNMLHISHSSVLSKVPVQALHLNSEHFRRAVIKITLQTCEWELHYEVIRMS